MTLEIDIEPLAQALATRAMEIIAEQKFNPPPDPLLSTSEIAAQLNVSEPKVRALVAAGYLKKTKGLTVIRVRQSVLNAYGKAPSK